MSLGYQQAALTASGLTARLRLIPLLAGRVRSRMWRWNGRPSRSIFDAAGNSNWTALIEALARSQKPDAKPLAAFSEMASTAAPWCCTTPRTNSAKRCTTCNCRCLAFDLQKLRRHRPCRLAWRAARHQRHAVGLSGGAGRQPHRREAAYRRRAHEGRPSKARSASIPRSRSMARSPPIQPRCAARWSGSGRSRCPAAALPAFAIKAQTNVVGSTIGLTSVNLELDGNSAEGVLTFANRWPPNVAGHARRRLARSFALCLHRQTASPPIIGNGATADHA